MGSLNFTAYTQILYLLHTCTLYWLHAHTHKIPDTEETIFFVAVSSVCTGFYLLLKITLLEEAEYSSSMVITHLQAPVISHHLLTPKAVCVCVCVCVGNKKNHGVGAVVLFL